MDNQRALQYALYGLGAVLWYILWQFFASMIDISFQYFNWAPVELPVLGPLRNVVLLVTLGIAGAAAELTRRQPATNKFGTECVTELRKVSWPNWNEIKGTTMVVVGVSLVVSAILWIFDKVFDFLISFIFTFDKFINKVGG